MVLRRPKPGGKNFVPFWSCSRWPDCTGTRNIGEDGKPEYAWRDFDSSELEGHPGHPSEYGDR